jgi:outer membrane receptor protein involved in Fe transport
VPGATPARFQNAVIDTPARALTTNVNGTARNNNNTRLDGTANVFVWLPHHSVYVASAETVDTVNIATNNFDAEQGMAGGAAITVVTKSGTNEFRGSGFWFHDNNDLKGRNFFLPADRDVPGGTRNLSGGTLGGPILRDRFFFFGSYDGTFERLDRFQNVSVPDEALRRGDFSALPSVIYDPLTGNPDGTGRTAFPNNQIPADRISPIAQRMLGFIPLPNQAGTGVGGVSNNFFNQSQQRMDRHQFDVKLNWTRTPAHQIWGKYGQMDAEVTCDFVFGIGGGPGLCDVGAGTGDTDVKIGTIGHTWTLSSNMVLDGTFGFSMFDQAVTTPDMGQNFGLDVLGLPGTNGPDPRQSGMPSFQAGFTAFGNDFGWTPIFRDDTSYTANTNVTWIKGSHDMRFGVDVVRHTLNHWQPEIGAGPRGRFVFGGGVTSLREGAAATNFNQFAAFLLGLPTSVQKSLQFELMTGREWQYAFFFRDRWQVSDQLTLTLGLRVERYPLMQRADRGIEAVDLNTLQVLLGGRGGNPEDLGITVKHPFAVPRLGLAYRLNDETVVRAGYGITIDPIPFSRPLRGFFPLTIAQDFASVDGFRPVAALADGIPDFTGPDLDTGRVPLPATAAMRTPELGGEIRRGYIHSWNVVVERRLPLDFVASAGYVGTATRDQLADLDINAAGPGEGRVGQPFFERFGRTQALNLWDGRVRGNYHSLQTSLNKPLTRGLLVRSSYTLSRARNETDESGWAGLLFNHPSVVGRNFALAGYDRTHVFQLGFLAELPFGRNGQGGGLAPVIRDWQVNAIVSAYSGNPFTVFAPGDSLNAPGNAQTADLLGTPSRTGSVQAGQPFRDPSAFAAVTEPRFGTSGRNSVRGPGHKNVDLSVFRSFPLRDRARLEARLEVFNLFNTPLFNNPVGNVTAANFMHITSAQEPFDRQIRFGARFSF